MNFKRIVAVRCVAALLFGVAGVCAHAAPDEIQVYTEELDAPGESGVELHLNHVPSGRTKPTYPGESQSAHRLQVTPEFSYGLTRTLEAGLYLPVAVGPDTGLVDNGIRFRLKFMAQFALNGDGLIRRARRIENWLPIQTDRVEGGRGEDG